MEVQWEAVKAWTSHVVGIGTDKKAWASGPFGRQNTQMKLDGLDTEGDKEAGAPGCHHRDGGCGATTEMEKPGRGTGGGTP